MAGLRASIRAVDRAVAWSERVAAVLLLAATVVVVLLQVVFRHGLDSSLSWAEEAARYLFIWAALLGFSSAIEAGQLFSFDLVYHRLPPWGQRLCKALLVVAAAAFLWALVVSGLALVGHTLSQRSPAMELPMALPYAALPVAGAGAALHFLAAFLEGGRAR